jgi:prepilin-type N-terminal cleavage/methylation domain-containing protein
MTRAARSREDGFTLIEVLLVSTLFLVVLGATIEAMVHFTANNRLTEIRNDQAEEARSALDRQARQLRNLAKRVGAPTINKAEGYDFIFQTSDPSRTWVRYCLDTTTAPATQSRGRLWEMVSSSSTVPDTAACPGATGAWESANVVADHISNRNGNADRPVFSYSCLGGATPCPPADSSLVTGVAATLWVDNDVTKDPLELRVSTAVFLRNQNEPPTAAFEITPLGTRKVFLNAAESSDPEGRTLRYYWYQAATAPSFNCATGPANTPTYFEGVALTYTFPTATATGTSAPFTLVVCDAGDLKAGPITQTTTVPAS